jgi:subtilisin family serine protease
MKQHIILKLHRPLADEARVPHWVDFASDKSVVVESVNPEIDRLMRERGLKFWLTKEYRSAGLEPSPEEIQAGLNRTYRMILQQAYGLPADLVERIRLIPAVEEARALDVGDAPLPPQFSAPASLKRTRSEDLIHLGYARVMSRGVPEIKIAVVDTGVDLNHRELPGKVEKGADFVSLEGLDTTGFVGDFMGYDPVPQDEVGHGTHVCGIVGAKGLRMDEGIAPGCGLMAVRALATMKQGERYFGAGVVDNINLGIKWAVDNGADVINMSLGIKHIGGGLPHADVIRYALSKNVSVVAASGNDGTAERYYPGALRGVFAVGAVDEAGRVAGFTSYGANIFVVAPGTNVYSAYARGGYAFASGTSQAAPFVSGAIGLLKSYAHEHGRRLTNQDVGYILKHTSDKVDSRLRNIQAGYGLINLADAFKLLAHWLS